MLFFPQFFKDEQTNKQTKLSFVLEIGPAALDLLPNLEVKFPINATQAGLFSPHIELLSKRKVEH